MQPAYSCRLASNPRSWPCGNELDTTEFLETARHAVCTRHSETSRLLQRFATVEQPAAIRTSYLLVLHVLPENSFGTENGWCCLDGCPLPCFVFGCRHRAAGASFQEASQQAAKHVQGATLSKLRQHGIQGNRDVGVAEQQDLTHHNFGLTGSTGRGGLPQGLDNSCCGPVSIADWPYCS